LGGAAIALPVLEIMGRPRSALAGSIPGFTSAGYPKRFVVFFSPNGTISGNWQPEGGERDFALSRILQPLARFRDRIVVIAGVDQQGAGGDGHQNGMGGMLTGAPLNPGPFQGGGGTAAGWPDGISVDQRIAQVIGRETRLRSLELAVQAGRDATNWSRMSYLGPNQPLPPQDDPYAVFERLFHFDRSRLHWQKSVLGSVMDDYRRLERRLGASDRTKLSSHLEAIREVEARLGVEPKAALAACRAPELGSRADVSANPNFPVVGRLQMDLLAMALACDLTRVASLQWSRSVSDVKFTWLGAGIDRGHHEMSHDGDSNFDTREKLTLINIWYAEQLAYLAGRLGSIPEGDSTLLDHTVILWCNELAKGNAHSRVDAPYVLLGGAGGAIRTGRYLDIHDNVPHNNLLLSLVHAMGIDDTSFGKREWCSGPLTRL
jgi:hypothetical protein